MERIPEPELMNDPHQARAYATADFAEPHERFVDLLGESFSATELSGDVLDLGCGPGDVTLRVARRYPQARLTGVDGAEAMLALGHAAVAAAGMGERVRLLHGYLPAAELPRRHYHAVISNSLLHHLADPLVLWRSIAAAGRPGAAVFVMDLVRPDSTATARQLVDTYSGTEPDSLKHDFYHSLLAAYRPKEIREQLAATGLTDLVVRVVSDRHLTVCGWLPQA